jgi:hypothetical protein
MNVVGAVFGKERCVFFQLFLSLAGWQTAQDLKMKVSPLKLAIYRAEER